MEPSCPLGTTHCIPQEKFPQKPYTNVACSVIVCSVKIAGYWPSSFFASLWTWTSSRSTNMQEKNLANIQPSWPYTWSITHTYWLIHWLTYIKKTSCQWDLKLTLQLKHPEQTNFSMTIYSTSTLIITNFLLNSSISFDSANLGFNAKNTRKMFCLQLFMCLLPASDIKE